MTKHVVETIKTILIVLLTLCAIALTLLAFSGSSFSGISWINRIISNLTQQTHYTIEPYESGSSAKDAALPTQISVKNSLGRATFQRSASTLESAYNTLGSLLGEALESLTLPGETLSERQWTQALQSESVYFRYSGLLPVSLISTWLDVQTPLDASAHVFLLEIHEEVVQLVCRTEGSITRYDTALSADQLKEALEGFRPDGSAFACELSDEVFSRLADDSLLSMERVIQLSAAACTNPLDNALSQQLATNLGMNPYGNFYTTTDGTTVYEEASRTLRVSANGHIELRNANLSNEQLCASSTSDADLSEFSVQLLQKLCSSVLADAQLSLVGIERTAAATTLQFDYTLSGIPVQLSGQSHAAELTFSGRSLTKFTIYLRSYTFSSEMLTLLPEKQAAAVVQDGSVLELHYLDTGSSELSAGWNKE